MTAAPLTPAESKRQFALSLTGLSEQLEPVYDAADGVRADLGRRGWSPTAAEAAALTWLQGALAVFWTSAAQTAATTTKEDQ